MWAIMKKEFKSYFFSPIGYIYLGIYFIMNSLFFYLDLFNYGSIDFSAMFGSVSTTMIFIIPILTMRMFSEERKTGTEQLLLTSPRPISEIVLGKFLGAGLIILISAVSSFIYFFILKFFGKPELGSFLTLILGIYLMGMAYVSFGMFASSITENQVVSAIISVGVFMAMWFLPYIFTKISDLSLINAFSSSFYIGTISIKSLVCILSFTIMFILLTMIVLQRRKNNK